MNFKFDSTYLTTSQGRIIVRRHIIILSTVGADLNEYFIEQSVHRLYD